MFSKKLQIVANKNTGIDVNKWDYFLRDCHYLGLQHEFDYRRLMQLSRVVESEGKYRICYSEKDANNILGMFRTRCSLHVRAYQHRDGVAVTHILRAAIVKILDVPSIYTNGSPISINTILRELTENNIERYLRLNDTMIHNIILNTSAPDHQICLKKAKNLLKKLKGEAVLHEDEYGSQRLPHRLSSRSVIEICLRELQDELARKPRMKLLSNLLETILQDNEKKKCLKVYLSNNPPDELKWLQYVLHRKKSEDTRVKAFLEEKIPPKLLLEKCIFEVMERKMEDIIKEVIEQVFPTNESADDTMLDEIIFAEKVELSYGSESEQTNPMDNVPFYREHNYELLRKGDCYVENESLHLFTPVKFALEEYWWYSGLEEAKEEDDRVTKAIASVLIKEVRALLNNKFD